MARSYEPSASLDITSMQSIKVDVRPALDSPTALIDRLVSMPMKMYKGETTYDPPPFFPSPQMKQAEASKEERITRNWQDIKGTCHSAKEKLSTCQSEQECGAAAVTLQRCIAGVVCPSIAEEFDTCTKAKPIDNSKAGVAFGKMVKCIELFELDTKFIQQQAQAK